MALTCESLRCIIIDCFECSLTWESLWLQCTGTLKSCSNSLYSFCSFLLRTLWKCILFCIRLVKVEILWLQTKLVCRLERTGGSTCETAANEVITLGIMLVRIVLHVHPMPVIQEFELIEINSFIHGRISYKHAGFNYISYILQLKRGALEV